MAKQRRKRKRKGGKPAGSSASSGGAHRSGGVMQSIRSGFKRAAGVEQSKEKSSTMSNIVWTLVLLAAVAFLIYRWYG